MAQDEQTLLRSVVLDGVDVVSHDSSVHAECDHLPGLGLRKRSSWERCCGRIRYGVHGAVVFFEHPGIRVFE